MSKTRHFVPVAITLFLIGLVVNVNQIEAQTEGVSLSIPSIGVDASITDAPLNAQIGTWDVSHLNMNVGHLMGTAWFGSGSNIVLGGHSETPSLTPDVFYNLDAVQVGNDIFVNIDGIQVHYIVTEVTAVSRFDMRIAYPTPFEQLTIITCQRDSYDSNARQYQSRVVVKAVLA